jgi:DNA-binding NarL/FixJ family response regulator
VEHQVIKTLLRTDVCIGGATRGNAEMLGPQPSGVKKLVLICRSRMLRECLEHMLFARAKDFEIESVSNVQQANLQRPDLVLVLLDLAVGGSKISEVPGYFADIQEHFTGIPVVAVAHQDSINLATHAMRCGLRGYILTSATSETVIAAIRLVLAGGTFLPSELLDLSPIATEYAEKARNQPFGDKTGLTEREVEIMKKLRQGHPNKVIAYQLKISANTVKAHMRNIMRKLHATNRTQLAFRVLESVGETTDPPII